MLIETLPAETWESTDDALALRQAMAGDESAFDRLYRQHYLKVANLAMQLVGDRDDAEDIAQAAFVRSFQALRKIKDGQSFEKYIIRTVVNLVRDRAKARKRKPWSFLLDAGESGSSDIMDIADHAVSPEESAIGHARMEALEKGIASLPLEFREVLVLHHLQGMDVVEIAHTLELPEGTVKSRLGRARQRLREQLGEWLR